MSDTEKDFNLKVNWGVFWAILVSLFFWGMIASIAAKAQGILPASTGCIGDSVAVMVREDVSQDSLALQEMLAHEAVHVAQITEGMAKNGGDCYDALWALTASPEANLEAEVVAYRAQADWLEANSQNFNRRAFYVWVARGLWFNYDGAIAIGDIVAALWDSKYIDTWDGEPVPPGLYTTGEHPPSRWHRSDPLTNQWEYR